ncbi:hypothetical protein [Mesorhizobium sp. M0847]|uniref:hypothetical protein n=1 Tax=unclassified Mesorhizobium TaxID=325217 RepID=UPI0033362EEE
MAGPSAGLFVPQPSRHCRPSSSEWAERGEITLEAAAQIMDVSVMTALRMARLGIIKGRQVCYGAPWAFKAADIAYYRIQNAPR